MALINDTTVTAYVIMALVCALCSLRAAIREGRKVEQEGEPNV